MIDRLGFDNEKYLEMQSEHIRSRINQFGGKLYLEFGGKLFDDHHASRVLPGFHPDSKIRMLSQLKEQVEIVVAVSAMDLEGPELLWSPETTAAVEAAAMRKTEAPARHRNPQARQRKQPQKKGLPLVPIIAGVIVVVLAALLVTKVIGPAIQKSKEAETISLVQTDVTLTAPGATETLVPVFQPEGSSAEVKWTCSNWAAVDVNPEGVLTAKAPGTALVAATLPNGESVMANITCTWDETAYAAEGGDVAAEPVVAGLSATEITLDAQGNTQQLALNGVTGAVKWTSSKPAVATVSADGTVSAISKGSAVITAESNGSKYTCNVRCVW